MEEYYQRQDTFSKEDNLVFERLLNSLEKDFQVKFNLAEIENLKNHFALNYPAVLITKSKNNKDVSLAIDNFLEKIKTDYAIDLNADLELKENLSKHLNTLVRVSKLNGKRRNPLLKVILSTFPYAYEITATSSSVLEEILGLELNEDELSFITLHVGAAMERQNTLTVKRKAAVICGLGRSTASMLRARLESQFGAYLIITGVYTYAEFKEGLDSDYNFLISTVPIDNSQVPVVQIDLNNFNEDINELYVYLQTITNPYYAINKLFDTDHIYLIENKMTKKQILDKLINDLELDNVVTKEFKKKCFDREKLYSTAVGGRIAIPHSLGFATNKSKVSFAILKKPIKWDEKNEVNYIFLLAIARKDYENIQKLFDFLVDLQTNARFRKIIDSCEDAERVKQAISLLIEKDTN